MDLGKKKSSVLAESKGFLFVCFLNVFILREMRDIKAVTKLL